MKIEIEEKEIMGLIKRYYKCTNGDGYLNTINDIFDNTIESLLPC